MNEILWVSLLRKACLGIGILGILVSLDIICGAKVYVVLNKLLIRMADIDKKLMATPKSKRIFGIMILILSLIILFLNKI